jgi:hypothetical protein
MSIDDQQESEKKYQIQDRSMPNMRKYRIRGILRNAAERIGRRLED